MKLDLEDIGQVSSAVMVAQAVEMIIEQGSRLSSVLSQLPEEMQDCTIRFKKCEVGHGRLTADNWIDNGCHQCRLGDATRLLAFAVKEWAWWKDDWRGTEPSEPEYAEARAFLLRNEPVVERREPESTG